MMLGMMIVLGLGRSCVGEFSLGSSDIGKHPITGEIRGEVYYDSCSRKNLPWYYLELNDREVKEFCESNPRNEYCKNAADRIENLPAPRGNSK
jgi:hypothetical protein